MPRSFHPYRAFGQPAATESIVLSSWLSHPLSDLALIDHAFDVCWVRESSSTMRILHGGREIDCHFSTYGDGRILDSFSPVLAHVYTPFVARHRVDGSSTLEAQVVTTILDHPRLRVTDPVVASLYGNGYTLQSALEDRPNMVAKGGDIYAPIPENWGVRVANAFAHETGQRSHLVRALEPRIVAEACVVWHSRREGVPDATAIQSDLLARYATPAAIPV